MDRARPTGGVRTFNLTGYLMPRQEDRSPFLLELPGDGDDIFLPVFSTVESMAAGMGPLGFTSPPFPGSISDMKEFLLSIPEETADGRKIRIVVDIHPVRKEDGTWVTRFHEVARDNSFSAFSFPQSRTLTN